MKIAFYDTKAYDKESFNKQLCLEPNQDIEIKYIETRLNKDTAELSKGCDVVCIFVNDDCSKEVIDLLYEYNIKLIALRCAGYNNVDVQACFGKIHVVHVPAYSPYAIAEHSFALMLSLIRNIHKAYNRTRDFNFSLDGLTGFDLHNKTIGIIGTGKIGCIMADISKGFGMKVLAYDSYPKTNVDFTYVSLNELLASSDIITLHCPLTSETKHLINSETIKQLKKGVIIVNTSRGGLIDTESLINGLKTKQIGGACLDVYEEEANIFFNDYSDKIMDDDTLSRLISFPNVIVTSHQAFLTKEALETIAETTLNNLHNFFEQKECNNELCYHCGKIEHCMKNQNIHHKCF